MTRAVLPEVAKEATNQLKYYPGAHGARTVLPKAFAWYSGVCLIYAVRAAFSFRQMPTTDTTIFEIGLSTETQIDSYHSLVGKPKTAIFYGKFCSLHSSLCLCSSRSNVETNHTVLQNLDLKDEFTFHFGFRIDYPRNVLKVVDIDENKTISSISFAVIDETYAVPVFGIPLPPSEGDSCVTLLNCKALKTPGATRVYGGALEKETIHQWIQSDLKAESWTLSLSRVPVQRGSTQLQRYQGAISSATVHGFIYRFWYFQLHVVILVKETLQQRCMVFEVGLCQKNSVDKHYCVAFQPNTYSFHAANCEEHSSICLFVTIGEELKYHEKLSANTAGTEVDKVFEFRLPKEFSVTVSDIDKAEDGGFFVTTDVPDLTEYVHTFGLYLLPENGDLTITLVNSYLREYANRLKEEAYTTEEPEDNTDSDSDSDDEADRGDDGCFDSTFDKKMGPIQSSDEDSGPSSFTEEKPLYDDSKESATFTYSADDSKMSELDSEVVYRRSKQPEPTFSTKFVDIEKQTMLNVIDGEDSEFLSNMLSTMSISDIRNVFNTCLVHGKIEFSAEVLKYVCRQIEHKEGNNCFEVYPSYRKGHRDDPILVLLERQYSTLHSEQYEGWTVVRRRYDGVSNEAAMVMRSDEVQRDLLDVDQMTAIEKAISQSDLPSKHSNITFISGCSYRSKNGGQNLEKCACIVVSCLIKGFIPYLEDPFPESIHGIPVDVREGYCVIGMMTPSDIPEISRSSEGDSGSEESTSDDSTEAVQGSSAREKKMQPDELTKGKVGNRSDEFNERLLIGAAIGPINGYRGTLGGFVELADGTMGFLTCAHVAERQSAEIVQPTRELPNPDDARRYVCGTVEQMICVCGTMDEVGIDAAFIKIIDTQRLPKDANFVAIPPEKLKFCGFEPTENPTFSSGETREFTKSKLTREERMMSVIKCGSETGLTRGIFNIDGAYCSSVNPTVINGTKRHVRMYKQFEILSIKELTRFSDNGDSGALVFLPKESLQCVGMVIGHTSYGSCIVTPIECILGALGVTFVDFRKEQGRRRKRKSRNSEGSCDFSIFKTQRMDTTKSSTSTSSLTFSDKSKSARFLPPRMPFQKQSGIPLFDVCSASTWSVDSPHTISRTTAKNSSGTLMLRPVSPTLAASFQPKLQLTEKSDWSIIPSTSSQSLTYRKDPVPFQYGDSKSRVDGDPKTAYIQQTGTFLTAPGTDQYMYGQDIVRQDRSGSYLTPSSSMTSSPLQVPTKQSLSEAQALLLTTQSYAFPDQPFDQELNVQPPLLSHQPVHWTTEHTVSPRTGLLHSTSTGLYEEQTHRSDLWGQTASGSYTQAESIKYYPSRPQTFPMAPGTEQYTTHQQETLARAGNLGSPVTSSPFISSTLIPIDTTPSTALIKASQSPFPGLSLQRQPGAEQPNTSIPLVSQTLVHQANPLSSVSLQSDVGLLPASAGLHKQQISQPGLSMQPFEATGGQRHLYKKDVDDCMSEVVVDNLRFSMRSVGAIITTNGVVGTAFRVGSIYVMTAYHVVKKITTDPAQASHMDVRRLAAVSVNFSGDPRNTNPQVFQIVPIIPYEDAMLDIAVLQLDTHSNANPLPQPFTLLRSSVVTLNLKTVSLVGYGHPGKTGKHLESSCRVIAKSSAEILEAKRWSYDNLNQYSFYTPDAYNTIDRNFNFVFNCFMEHGASGSPVICTHDPNMPVVGVFTHGLPSYLFDLPPQDQSQIPYQCRFEIATDIGYIYYDMLNKNRALAMDLFR